MSKTYNCANCGSENKWTHQKINKFCNNKCQGEYKWKTETVPRFEQGLVSRRDTIRKVLTEQRGYNCAVCEISEHNNMPITLQVDHIDGDAGNHNPNNVRLICPNCHSQTPTYAGRNKGYGRGSRGLALS